jgi:hypothetical protein
MKSYEFQLSIVQKWLQLLPHGYLLPLGYQADLVHQVGQADAVDQADLAAALRLGE